MFIEPDSERSTKFDFLWKYLDLYKMMDFVQTNSIYFHRFDRFEDPIEGLNMNTLALKELAKAPRLTVENINKNYSDKDQKREIAEDNFMREKIILDSHSTQKSQYASCWFSSSFESLAMWNIYSNRTGLALKFPTSQLIDKVETSGRNIVDETFKKMYFGSVEYLRLSPFNFEEKFNKKFNGLKKDVSYSYENEFRFVVCADLPRDNNPESFKLEIQGLGELDFDIVVSPYISNWQFEVIKKLLKFYSLDERLKKSVIQVR